MHCVYESHREKISMIIAITIAEELGCDELILVFPMRKRKGPVAVGRIESISNRWASLTFHTFQCNKKSIFVIDTRLTVEIYITFHFPLQDPEIGSLASGTPGPLRISDDQTD